VELREFLMSYSHGTAAKIEMYLPRFSLSLSRRKRMITMQILFSIRSKWLVHARAEAS
jgi:hypothetical protein